MAVTRGCFRWSRLMTLFVVLWFGFLIYFLYSMVAKNNEAETSLRGQLEATRQQLARTERENGELRALLKEVQEQKLKAAALEPARPKMPPGVDLNLPDLELMPPREKEKAAEPLQRAVSRAVDGPSREYEVARRQTERDLNELWWFVRASLNKLADQNKDSDARLSDKLRHIVEDAGHRHKAVLADLTRLRESDGHEGWRRQEARDLGDLVQRRLHALQNPSDCDNNKKLVCSLNKGCGYGCQIHHAVYCFIVAYGTERQLVLKSRGWRYDKKGFEDVFQPLSETCPNPQIAGKKPWPGSSNVQVVELGIIDSINPRPKFLPPAIPRDLSDRIIRLHGDPVVWWVAQFLKYMLRPAANTEQLLSATEKAFDLTHPSVGIHVRRTDKIGTEAAFHGVDEYMKYVAEYFDQLEVKEGRKIARRQVYVASDDPKVLAECRKLYPDYVFSGDPSVAKSAAVSSRYNLNSLRGIITDIHMLSKTDFVVCTFSSQVCRIAYELMQLDHVDAADRFKSLDDVWYFGGQDGRQLMATIEHAPRNKDEIAVKPGDILGVAGNHWDGFNKGRNYRTSRVGLYPLYKTTEKHKIEDFPTFPHVEL